MAMKQKYYEAYQIILKGINQSGYEDEPYYNGKNDEASKMQFLKGKFLSEYSHEIKRQNGSEFPALVKYLKGLGITIPFYNWQILDLSHKMGLSNKPRIELTVEEEDIIIERYWRFMTIRIKELWIYYGVN